MASNNQTLVTLLQLLAGKVPQAVNPGIQFDPSAPFAQPPVLGIGQPPQQPPQQPKPQSTPGQAPQQPRPAAPGQPAQPPQPPQPGQTPAVDSTIKFGDVVNPGDNPTTEAPSNVYYPGFGPDPTNGTTTLDPGNLYPSGYVAPPAYDPTSPITNDPNGVYGSGYSGQNFTPMTDAGGSGGADGGYAPSPSDYADNTPDAGSYDYFGG